MNGSVRIKWGVVAACLALMIFGVTGLLSREEPERNPALPMLSISETTATSMGYEGYMAYDISELINANPWKKDSETSVLPVFQNTVTYDSGVIAAGTDFDKMKALLLDVAGRLGLDTNSLSITDKEWDDETQQLIIKADGLKIEVDQAMTAKVTFNPPVPLPEEYNFTHFAPYDDKAAAAEYLKSKYADFIGFDNPQVNLYGGDYNIYNQQMYSIEFFDANGNETEQLINYNFNRVTFGCNDEGRLFIARIYQPDLSVKIGDYPIIDSRQAKELLLKGNYITTVPYEISEKESIKKVELVYRTGEGEECFMPYYRFYVELPDEEQENGLKTYGAYYVPAVEGSYISNMPVWDGGFQE